MNRPRDPSTTMNPTGEVRNGHGSEAETESSCGETLFERMLQPEILSVAWKRVKANKGSAGIDGMSVEEFPTFIRKHWEKIRLKLLEGSYEPSPLKRVYLKKPDGSRRLIGVPTVRVHCRPFPQRLGIGPDHPSLSPAERAEVSCFEETALWRSRERDPAQFAGWKFCGSSGMD